MVEVLLFLICNNFKYERFKIKRRISHIKYAIFKFKPKISHNKHAIFKFKRERGYLFIDNKSKDSNFIFYASWKFSQGRTLRWKWENSGSPSSGHFSDIDSKFCLVQRQERGKRIFSGQCKISPLLLNIGWQGLFENYFNILVSLNRQQRGTFTNSSQPIWIHRQSFKYIWHLAHYKIEKTNQSSTGCGCVMCIFFAILKIFFFV